MGDVDPAVLHREAVEAGDWERARELERDLIQPTDNTERPEDGPQPPQDPGPPPDPPASQAAGGEPP